MSKQINDLNKSLEEQLHLNEKQDKTDNTLKTNDKTVVGAINELFQNVDSGKQLIATAIDDSSITKDSTFDVMGTAITLLNNQITSLTNELAGKVTPAGTAVAEDVLSGKTFINSTGKTVTGTIANRGGAQTITPGTSNKTLNAGYYSGNITVAGDADLVAANIVSGKNIFGVAGSATVSSLGGASLGSISANSVLVSGTTTNVTIPVTTVSKEVLYFDETYSTALQYATNYVKAIDNYTVKVTGNIIVSLYVHSGGTSGIQIQITKNGSVVVTDDHTTTRTEGYSLRLNYPVSVKKGDKITLEYKRGSEYETNLSVKFPAIFCTWS